MLYFGQSTSDCSILQSVVKTAFVVPLRNTYNVHVVDFTTKIFVVYFGHEGRCMHENYDLNNMYSQASA